MKKGIACRLVVNNDGEVIGAKDPSGAPSVLFESALRETGDVNAAAALWATAYTDEYQSTDGWMDASNRNNKEPSLSKIIAFVNNNKERNAINSSMYADMESIAKSIGIDVEDVPSAISNHLYGEDGNISLTEKNMTSSGLYTQKEINDMMDDDVLRASVEDRLNDLSMITQKDFDSIYGENDTPPFFDSNPMLSMPLNEKNGIGKDNMQSGDAVMRDIMNDVSKGEDMSSLLDNKYPSVGSVYSSDEYVKDMIDNIHYNEKYGSLRPAVVMNDDGTVRNGITGRELIDGYDISQFSKVSNEVTDILNNMSEGSMDFDKIKALEMTCAKAGIDIAGLTESLYGISDDLYNRLFDLLSMMDVFVNNATEDNANALASLINTFISSDNDTMPVYTHVSGDIFVSRSSQITGIDNIVPIENGFDGRKEVTIYIRSDMSINDMYNTLYDSVGESTFNITNGSDEVSRVIIDYNKNKDKKEHTSVDFIRELSEAIGSIKNSYDTEYSILARLCSGYYGRYNKPSVNRTSIINNFSRRYYNNIERLDKSNRFSIADALYKKKLIAKVENNDAYNMVWRFIDMQKGQPVHIDELAGYAMRDVLDNETLSQLDLYSLMMPDESNMAEDYFHSFENRDKPSRADNQSLSYIYSKMPLLVENEYKGNVIERGDDIVAVGEYDDFIRVGGSAYMKIDELPNGGLYRSVGGTDWKSDLTTADRFSEIEYDDSRSNVTARGYNNVKLKEC